MGFFTALTDNMTSRQRSGESRNACAHPEMLRNWASPRGLGGEIDCFMPGRGANQCIELRSHVCAYIPSLGDDQAMGSAKAAPLMVEENCLSRPRLIIDIKHGDLKSSSAIAAYLFKTLRAIGSLNPLAGQDIRGRLRQ